MGCSASQSTKVASSNNNNATIGIQKKESNNSGKLSSGSLGMPEHRKKRSSGSARFSVERVDSLPEEQEPNEGEDITGEEDDDDDEVFPPSENNRQPENGFQDNKLGNDANGDFGKKPLKNVPLSGPLYSGNTQFSRSQTDFFKMLDEKIATGQSLSSQESVR
ncbi:hypothetical protein HOLleu_15669 [Holothuria leucospilota]|uniref:Uncharacterized protein n=1 Tax=Holothuria leucospilota TaxID=206669 RepID=A0A9Q1C516_HOLLE|nr:hypothetical protein HOLleu_15669 [Holothuria leucospilota]